MCSVSLNIACRCVDVHLVTFVQACSVVLFESETLVAMPTWGKSGLRKHRAGLKYKKLNGEKWIIDTSRDRGSVRPIDLVSRDPDRLREHDSKEAAVAFDANHSPLLKCDYYCWY